MIDPDETPPPPPPADEPAADGGENEGEGSRSAARDYERRVQAYLAEANVTTQAREAADALDGAEGEALREAEAAGRDKADDGNVKVSRER